MMMAAARLTRRSLLTGCRQRSLPLTRTQFSTKAKTSQSTYDHIPGTFETLINKLSVAGPALLAAGFLTYTAVSVVPAGHVGVVVLFGVVEDEPLQPGFHLLNPFKLVRKFSCRTQMVKADVHVPSNEGLNVDLSLAVLYRLKPENVCALYKTVGENYEEVILIPHIRSTVRNMTSQYEAKALYTAERTSLTTRLCSELNSAVQQRGIVVEETPLRRLALPKQLTQAIEEKLRMEQESQRMKFVLLKEQQEARRKAIEAQGIAEFQRIVTDGISPKLLQWKGIEATQALAESHNAKVVVIGNSKDGLPIILGGGGK